MLDVNAFLDSNDEVIKQAVLAYLIKKNLRHTAVTLQAEGQVRDDQGVEGDLESWFKQAVLKNEEKNEQIHDSNIIISEKTSPKPLSVVDLEDFLSLSNEKSLSKPIDDPDTIRISTSSTNAPNSTTSTRASSSGNITSSENASENQSKEPSETRSKETTQVRSKESGQKKSSKGSSSEKENLPKDSTPRISHLATNTTFEKVCTELEEVRQKIQDLEEVRQKEDDLLFSGLSIPATWHHLFGMIPAANREKASDFLVLLAMKNNSSTLQRKILSFLLHLVPDPSTHQSIVLLRSLRRVISGGVTGEVGVQKKKSKCVRNLSNKNIEPSPSDSIETSGTPADDVTPVDDIQNHSNETRPEVYDIDLTSKSPDDRTRKRVSREFWQQVRESLGSITSATSSSSSATRSASCLTSSSWKNYHGEEVNQFSPAKLRMLTYILGRNDFSPYVECEKEILKRVFTVSPLAPTGNYVSYPSSSFSTDSLLVLGTFGLCRVIERLITKKKKILASNMGPKIATNSLMRFRLLPWMGFVLRILFPVLVNDSRHAANNYGASKTKIGITSGSNMGITPDKIIPNNIIPLSILSQKLTPLLMNHKNIIDVAPVLMILVRVTKVLLMESSSHMSTENNLGTPNKDVMKRISICLWLIQSLLPSAIARIGEWFGKGNGIADSKGTVLRNTTTYQSPRYPQKNQKKCELINPITYSAEAPSDDYDLHQQYIWEDEIIQGKLDGIFESPYADARPSPLGPLPVRPPMVYNSAYPIIENGVIPARNPAYPIENGVIPAYHPAYSIENGVIPATQIPIMSNIGSGCEGLEGDDETTIRRNQILMERKPNGKTKILGEKILCTQFYVSQTNPSRAYSSSSSKCCSCEDSGRIRSPGAILGRQPNLQVNQQPKHQHDTAITRFVDSKTGLIPHFDRREVYESIVAGLADVFQKKEEEEITTESHDHFQSHSVARECMVGLMIHDTAEERKHVGNVVAGGVRSADKPLNSAEKPPTTGAVFFSIATPTDSDRVSDENSNGGRNFTIEKEYIHGMNTGDLECEGEFEIEKRYYQEYSELGSDEEIEFSNDNRGSKNLSTMSCRAMKSPLDSLGSGKDSLTLGTGARGASGTTGEIQALLKEKPCETNVVTDDELQRGIYDMKTMIKYGMIDSDDEDFDKRFEDRDARFDDKEVEEEVLVPTKSDTKADLVGDHDHATPYTPLNSNDIHPITVPHNVHKGDIFSVQVDFKRENRFPPKENLVEIRITATKYLQQGDVIKVRINHPKNDRPKDENCFQSFVDSLDKLAPACSIQDDGTILNESRYYERERYDQVEALQKELKEKYERETRNRIIPMRPPAMDMIAPPIDMISRFVEDIMQDYRICKENKLDSNLVDKATAVMPKASFSSTGVVPDSSTAFVSTVPRRAKVSAFTKGKSPPKPSPRKPPLVPGRLNSGRATNFTKKAYNSITTTNSATNISPLQSTIADITPTNLLSAGNVAALLVTDTNTESATESANTNTTNAKTTNKKPSTTSPRKCCPDELSILLNEVVPLMCTLAWSCCQDIDHGKNSRFYSEPVTRSLAILFRNLFLYFGPSFQTVLDAQTGREGYPLPIYILGFLKFEKVDRQVIWVMESIFDLKEEDHDGSGKPEERNAQSRLLLWAIRELFSLSGNESPKEKAESLFESLSFKILEYKYEIGDSKTKRRIAVEILAIGLVKLHRTSHAWHDATLSTAFEALSVLTGISMCELDHNFRHSQNFGLYIDRVNERLDTTLTYM